MADRRPYAIFAITKHGIAIARRLMEHLPHADLYVSRRLHGQAPEGARPIDLPMGPVLRETFQAYDCHVHIISVGAVVRMIAPLLENKKVDPAVVCVDDAARFSVCVLSGHVGQGNLYAQRVAEILQATPVITTASDVGGTLTVDILGRELGWQLDDPDRNVTAGCAAVVNEDPVAFVQETGEPSFWPLDKKLPANVRYVTSLDEVDPADYRMLLIASDRLLDRTHPAHFERAVIYRPKSLVLGVGCDRGAAVETLEKGIRHHLQAAGLDLRCVASVATVDKKLDEPGLVELCRRFDWALHGYAPATLDRVDGIETPSEVVRKYVGTRSVAEAACLLRARALRLTLAKQAYREGEDGLNMTVAAARIQFDKRREEHHGQ